MKKKLLYLVLLFPFIFNNTKLKAQELDSSDGIQIPITQGTSLAELPVVNTRNFTNIYWSDTESQQDGKLISSWTKPNNNSTYYAFQSVGNCATSLPVKVLLYDAIPAPVYDGEMPITLCTGVSYTLADLPITNTEGYDTIFWFSTPDQLIDTDLPEDTIVEDLTYYAFQGIGDEAVALEVTFSFVSPIPAPIAPFGVPIIQCSDNGHTLGDLLVYNTVGYESIYWFSTPTQDEGSLLDPTTEIEEDTTYYAFQAIGCSDGCAEALEVTVQMEDPIPPVTGDTNQYFCASANPTVADLVAYNTDGYDYILWYAICCPNDESEALDPDLLLEDGVNYYAHQGISHYCNYGYFRTTVHLETIPAPAGEQIQTHCCGATFADLYVYPTGDFDTIYWFASDDNTGTPISITEVLDTNTYFAFQSLDECAESLEVNVQCQTPPPSPVGESEQYLNHCDGISLSDLLVFNTEGYDNIYWFSSSYQMDGTELPPNTQVEDGVTYYAFQSVGDCAGVLSVTVYCLIGIEEETTCSFNILPNPVKDQLTIETTSSLDKLKIRVIDALGKSVSTSELSFEDGRAILNVSRLETGIYFIEVESKNNIQSKRFIKK